MPTERQLYRMYAGGGDDYDLPTYPSRRSSLLDLTMAQGQQRAEGYLRSGELWGNTIANIGQGIGQYYQQKDEAKKKKTRDDAYLAIMQDPKSLQDPKYAHQQFLRVGGPEDGLRMFQAFAGGIQLLQPNRDPEKDQKGAASAILGLRSIKDPQKRAAAWSVLSGPAAKVFGDHIPQQYDEDTFTNMLVPWAESQLPKAPRSTKVVEGALVDDQTGEPLYTAPKEAKPETRSLDVQLADAAARGDQAAYDRLLKVKRDSEAAGRVPAGPKDPKLVQIETVGPDGKPVTQFVTPSAGTSYPKPTGQAKPASGQQRKALGFFNRGKEAGEIADQLEEKVAGAGMLSSLQLQYGHNILQTKEQQQYRQAQRAFTEARLRKESGATIKDDEYENDAKTYFAQPGDSKELREQKRKLRHDVLRGVALEAGDALREFYGDESEDVLKNYGGPGMQGGPKKISTDAEFDDLPSGTEFIGPDGVKRRKP